MHPELFGLKTPHTNVYKTLQCTKIFTRYCLQNIFNVTLKVYLGQKLSKFTPCVTHPGLTKGIQFASFTKVPNIHPQKYISREFVPNTIKSVKFTCPLSLVTVSLHLKQVTSLLKSGLQ